MAALEIIAQDILNDTERGKRELFSLSQDLDDAKGVVRTNELQYAEEEGTFEDRFTGSAEVLDGNSGAEEFEKMKLADLLLEYFGIKNQDTIAGIYNTVGADEVLSPDRWREPGWYEDPAHVKTFHLDKLQWDGVAKTIVNDFECRPTLNMDEVGTGKTFQVLMKFVVIALMRDYHTQNKEFAASQLSE
jgi:hypothetical protein